MHVILPKTLVEAEHFRGLPFLFLAGPVRGGGDWQAVMCRALAENLSDDFVAAIPCRYATDHPLVPLRLPGNENIFPRQLNWERHHLSIAGTRSQSCIIFWLPCESEIEPRNDGNPYAMETRGEIAEWRTHKTYNRKVPLVVGAEPGFPGLSSIQRNFNLALGHEFRIYDSLDEVAHHAAAIVNP